MRCDGRDNRKKLCDFVFIVGGGRGGGWGGWGGRGERRGWVEQICINRNM